ncbi:prepilin peptidase [Patescibacteria group bacterium]|nr:prepilin peptidase [Patescibacteria group bacterium]
MIVAFSFIAGLFIGSFLNVVADRLCREENPFTGRSACDLCGQTLKPGHLVPVVSYLLLKGKCAYCGKGVSRYYPMSELLTGASFVLAVYLSGFGASPTLLTGVQFGYLLVVFSVFIIIILSDLKYQLIPDQVVYFGLAFVFLAQVGSLGYWLFRYHGMLQSDALGQYLLHGNFFKASVLHELTSFGYNIGTGLVIALFFYLLVVLTKGRGMGGGDVKLGLLLGLVNGFPDGFVAVFLAFIIGSVVSLGLMAFSKKGLKDVVPFGPFLILGSVLSLLYGDWIVSHYLAF